MAEDKKYMMLVNQHDQTMAMVTSELIDTKVIGLLAAGICRIFEEAYESPMPIPNLVDCLTGYYNVEVVMKDDYPLKNMIDGEDMHDVVLMAHLDKLVESISMEDVRSILGITYPSIKSYLNGRHGDVENFAEDWDDDND